MVQLITTKDEGTDAGRRQPRHPAPAFLIVYLGGAVVVSIVMLKRLEEPTRKALRRRLAA
jgi:hypothetical protein